MSGLPFYKKPAAAKSGFDWPPKKVERPVKISRQEPPPEQAKAARKIWKFSKTDKENSSSQVKEGSRAENAGLKLGDSIVTINGNDTNEMTLQEANTVLEQAAQQDVQLGVIKWVEILFGLS